MNRLVEAKRQFIAATAAYARANVVGYRQRTFAPGEKIAANDLPYMPIAVVFRPGITSQVTITVGRDPSFSNQDLSIDLNGLGPNLFQVVVLMPGETLFCTSAFNPQGFYATVMV